MFEIRKNKGFGNFIFNPDRNFHVALILMEIEDKLLGITCGRRPISCADQLAKAVRAAYRGQTE